MGALRSPLERGRLDRRFSHLMISVRRQPWSVTCDTSVRSPQPPNAILEQHGFPHCKCSGRDRPARTVKRTGRKDMGRHHRRRRPQRPCLRRLPRARRPARAGHREPPARRRRLHHRRAVPRREDVALRLSRRPAPSANCRRTRSPAPRLSVDTRRQRPLRALPRRLQHPALGRRRALRRRSPRPRARR